MKFIEMKIKKKEDSSKWRWMGRKRKRLGLGFDGEKGEKKEEGVWEGLRVIREILWVCLIFLNIKWFKLKTCILITKGSFG